MTKSKSGTLMSEMKTAWEADFKKYNYENAGKKGHCIDQMLRMYAEHNTNIWTVGTNLWSMQWVWYGDSSMACSIRTGGAPKRPLASGARCARTATHRCRCCHMCCTWALARLACWGTRSVPRPAVLWVSHGVLQARCALSGCACMVKFFWLTSWLGMHGPFG